MVIFMPFCRLKNRNITKILPIFAKNRISAAYRNPSIYKGKIDICIFECSKFLPKFFRSFISILDSCIKCILHFL